MEWINETAIDTDASRIIPSLPRQRCYFRPTRSQGKKITRFRSRPARAILSRFQRIRSGAVTYAWKLDVLFQKKNTILQTEDIFATERNTHFFPVNFAGPVARRPGGVVRDKNDRRRNPAIYSRAREQTRVYVPSRIHFYNVLCSSISSRLPARTRRNTQPLRNRLHYRTAQNTDSRVRHVFVPSILSTARLTLFSYTQTFRIMLSDIAAVTS